MTKSSLFTFLLLTASAKALFSQAVPISSVPGLAATLVPTACTGKSNLLCALPNIYGQYGLVLPNPGIAGSFNLNFQGSIIAGAATQLSIPVLANPASGFVYKYDPSTDLYTRTSQSLGPVLAERGETLGRHKFAFGTNAQRFRYKSVDGVNLHSITAINSANPSLVPAGDPSLALQYVTLQNSADIRVNVLTAFATYGLTNRVDISVAVPFVQVGYNLNSIVTIHRFPGTDPILTANPANPSGAPIISCCSNGGPGPLGPVYANYFDPKNPAASTVREFSNNQSTAPGDLYYNPNKNSAAGIGDVTFRIKANVYQTDRVSMALVTDVRLPTGDATNFLGSGTWGLRPLLAVSVREGWLTPHLNVGYQFNGSSVLSGDPYQGTSSKLPGSATFAAGSDIPFSKYVAFSLDYIGAEYVNSPQFTVQTINGPAGEFQSIVSTGKHVYNQSGAAGGIKISAFNRLLFTANALVSLTKSGVRQRVTPLVGLSYVF